MIMTENRMVVDSEWEWNESTKIKEKMNDPGYKEINTGIFVPEEDAFEYAMERVSQDENLKREFLDWFYSDNWIKED